MKSLARRPPYELIHLTAFCLVIAALVWAWFWQEYGVAHRPNSMLGVWLILVATTFILGGLGLSTLFCSVISVRRSSWKWFIAGLVSSVTALVVAANTTPLFQAAATLAERRDFTAVGLKEVRDAARVLVESRPSRDAEQSNRRWFGTEVPHGDLPPALIPLAANAAYVSVNEQGVVILTDGMGGWRSGYLILPPGSTHIPPYSRRISEGIYYVTSTTGG